MISNLEAQPMQMIKQKLAIIGEIIPSGSQIVYLDYPVHENVGDLLIMKGTEAFFIDYGINVRKRYSYINFRKTMKIPEDWIIVCHGGGNFGDLYPMYQQMRERVVQAYPRNRIVVLPQTIHFQSPAEEQRSLRYFSNHSDFHLFVRDETSYEKASKELANVYIAPDMAHQLYPLPSHPANSKRKLALLRTDGEVHKQNVLIPLDCDKEMDWPHLFSVGDLLLLKLIVKAYGLDRLFGNILPLTPFWYFLADRYIARAIRLYNEYDQIITSRLHGHILSCLMNKPSMLLDNNYGKNMSYYRLWTYRLEESSSEIEARSYGGDLYTKSS
jgi:pyruvyl transferase EpsO